MSNLINIRKPENFFELAKLHIYKTYGDVVEFMGDIHHGIGKADAIGTTETEINALNQNETYLTDNLIDTISSSNNGDTQEMHIVGMTISGNVLTKVSQYVTLTGQTKATLTTPLARVIHFETHDATDLAGDVYIYEDTAIVAGVPTDLSKAHDMVPGGTNNASLKISTSVQSTQYMLFHHFYANVNKKTSSQVDINLKVRTLGGPIKIRYPGSVSDAQGQLTADFEPYLIIPPNSDIIVTGTSANANTDVSVGFFGYYADIITDGVLITKTRPWI